MDIPILERQEMHKSDPLPKIGIPALKDLTFEQGLNYGKLSVQMQLEKARTPPCGKP